MTIIKRILAVVAILLVAIGLYLMLFLDLNSYKPQLAERVKAATGRDLVIEGDIGWSLYPNLGLELQGLSLGNLPGEALPPLLTIDDASVGVGLFALVRGELEVEKLAINGATLDWITLEDGRTSLTGLGKARDEATSETSADAATPEPPQPAKRWRLGKVAVKDLTFRHDNRQQGTTQHLKIDELTLDRIEPGRAAPFTLALTLGDGSQTAVTRAEAMLSVSQDFSRIQLDDWRQTLALRGNSNLELDLATNADLDLAAQRFAFSNLALEMGDFRLTGQGSADLLAARPKVRIQGQGNQLDLRPWFGGPAQDAPQTKDQEQEPPHRVGEPDLSALGQVDLSLEVGLDALILPQTTLSDLAMDLELEAGVLAITKLRAGAFDGEMAGTLHLDSRVSPAQYQFQNRISNLDIQPLLIALADNKILAGRGNLRMTGQGTGLQANTLMETLAMEGELSLTDGALYGVNVAQLVRDNWAKIQGEFDGNSAVQKTDFASLLTSFQLDGGTFTTPSLAVRSPLLRIDGAGEMNLVSQTLDYALTVALVGDLEGQGGKKVEELANVPVPVTISGSLAQPQYAVDLDDLLKGKLEQEKDRLEDKLKKKLFEKLGGF